MSVVGRLGGWLVVAGLAVGLALRLLLGRRRFGPLLTAALLLPWGLHAGYVSIQGLTRGLSGWGVLAFVAAGALLAIAATWAGRRFVEGRGLVAALLPAALGAVYILGPFLLLSLALRRAGIDLDVVPTAAYGGACLFASAVLLPFAPRGARAGGAGGGRAWPRRRP
ncbi:MAG TPA: hypothetical protein VKA00_05775 [Trueperaceae bacterium]|nr:hypothetical protein [Trueperaceae bacterium]